METYAFTGHRPNKLPGGYDKMHPANLSWLRKVRDLLSTAEVSHGITVISGMALGVDQWCLMVAMKLFGEKAHYIAAIPFVGQEKIWPESSQKEYRELLERVEGFGGEIVYVSKDTSYKPKYMDDRNKWMVDRATKIVAIWDHSAGGTGNCVAYAVKQRKPICIIDPREDREVTSMKRIDSFRGDYMFLSNFSNHPVTLVIDGEEVPFRTSEHAYQYFKTDSAEWKKMIRDATTPGIAKKLSKRAPMRENWDNIKLEVMYRVVTAKFKQNPGILKKLIETGDAELIEGNQWGDRYWGTVAGHGQNHLGKILMRVRKELR